MINSIFLAAVLLQSPEQGASLKADVLALQRSRGEFGGIVKTQGKAPAYHLRVGTERVPVEELVHASIEAGEPRKQEPPSRAPCVIVLPDGSEVHGSLLSGTADSIRIRSESIKELKVPLGRILAVLFPPSFKRKQAYEAFRLSLEGSSDLDVLYSTNGKAAEGILQKLTPEKVVVSTNKLGEMDFPVDSVKGIALAQLESYTPGTDLQLGVILRDNTFLWGAIAGGGSESFRIDTLLGELEIGFRQVKELIARNGRWTFLGELEPGDVQEKSFLGEKTWHMKKNRNVLGRYLRVRGKRYLRGIGVHSYSKITYNLGGKYVRFQALAALDDCAVPASLDERFGNVAFRVFVNGEKRFDSGAFSWNDPPQRISVDTKGAETLTLEVDYAEGFHVRDRAGWIRARLLKPAQGSEKEHNA